VRGSLPSSSWYKSLLISRKFWWQVPPKRPVFIRLKCVTCHNTARDAIRSGATLLVRVFRRTAVNNISIGPHQGDLFPSAVVRAVHYTFLRVARSRTELVSLLLENIPEKPSKNTSKRLFKAQWLRYVLPD
jgi:hypothetical protein